MKRRGSAPVVMDRVANLRECPECLKQMRLARCPDHNVATRELSAPLRRPVAV